MSNIFGDLLIEDETDAFDIEESTSNDVEDDEDFEIDGKTVSFNVDNIEFNTEPDDDDNEEEITVKSETSVKRHTLDNSYLQRLGDMNMVDDCVTMNEFGLMEITYKNVRNPDNIITDYFSSHCKIINENNKQYYTSNQLSNHYVYTSIEKLVEDHIKPNFNLVSEPSISVSPFYCTWVGTTDYNLGTIDDSISREMFKFCSGMSVEESLENINSNIAIIIKNTYDGKKTISMSLGIKLQGIDSSGKKIMVDDYFTLGSKSTTYFHKGIKLQELSENIEKIETDFENDISILKAYKPTDEEVLKISRNMSKAKSKLYKNSWTDFPVKYKNLYYNLLFLSSVINSDYIAREHINVQTVVDSLIKKAQQAHKA